MLRGGEHEDLLARLDVGADPHGQLGVAALEVADPGQLGRGLRRYAIPTRRPASASTSPRCRRSVELWPDRATSGGEIWITGSPRSSARQIRPALAQSAARGSRGAASRTPRRRTIARVCLVLHELDRVEEARAAQVADDRQLEQLRERRAERVLVARAPGRRCRSRFMISMFFSAIAHITGWPPNVIPCAYIDVDLEERLHHPLGRDHRADRRVGRGQALRAADDVRPDVVALGRRTSGRRRPKAVITSSAESRMS